MIKPITLTKEELDELKKPRVGVSVYSNWNRDWGNAYGYNDWATPSSSSTRKRHEYVKDVWFTSKVFWTCKHCGAKKEDPKAGDYCDNTNDDFDTGGW
jgi:hypothetical protein